MKILYIFPHPDDESFGPAPAIHAQVRSGHAVHLLTLTRGEATRVRHKLGISKEEMGRIRSEEMQCVAEVLGLTELKILDLEDSGFQDMDPRKIENAIRPEIERVKPDVVVTYGLHGVSGFPDHLVTHAVVKRVYLELKENGADYLKRLAFFILCEKFNRPPSESIHQLHLNNLEEVDCVMQTEPDDRQAFLDALDCYKTYQDIIQNSGVKKTVGDKVCFKFFQEDMRPPLTDLTADLKNGNRTGVTLAHP